MAKKTAEPAKNSGSNRNLIVIGGAIILGVLALGYLIFANLQGDTEIAGLTQYAGLSRDHDNTTTYEGTLPPAGGEHYDVWQTCGVYEEAVLPGYAIHSMEHGAVWITYDPALPTDEIAALQDKVMGETYLLPSPFPDQESPVVLTAWGVQLVLESADDSRAQEFIDRYRQGPTTPERGASCANGNGLPLQ